VSDKCVRYTGDTYESVGIEAGDSLYQVEIALIEKTISFLNGSGINISINPVYLCNYMQTFLPAGSTFNVPTIISGIVRAICDTHSSIISIDNTLAILNANYTIGCLTGVTASSDTHDIVQAIINKLCTVAADLDALELNVDTNYVKLADLDALIAAYIASTSGGGSTQQYLKMVPYVAYEYYGPLTNFDGSGIGIPAAGFYQVYLCNGLNGTPDKRGRVAVGAINNVPPIGLGLDSAVDPNNPGNPNYDIYTTAGANTITLVTSQIPSHNHTGIGTTTVTLNDPGHFHFAGRKNDFGGASGSIGLSKNLPQDNQSTTSTTGITITSNTPGNVALGINNTGGDGSHANIQPVIGAYYIMYIP